MRRTLVAAALLALAAGCGQSPPTSGVASVQGTKTPAQATATPTGSSDPEEKSRKFAACMREHGVEMPDPEADGGRMRITIPKGIGKDKMDKAMEACRALGPMGEKRGPVPPEEQERLRAFVKCMRDNGVDLPDPDFTDGGGVRIGGPNSKIKPDDPVFKKADEACRDKLGGPLKAGESPRG
ncbi:hypothetical protein [Sphaerisporangium corydalis]|uniref:Uncharacterized protein n=1 Tax=Sphaerisporangium corydalis TaxID=1441875 RepID=A0ABV9EIT4_9ACTN|nr:hypothetical protein [Sphaerisporangium corydalis]